MRIKRSVPKTRKHKKILSLTKGYRLSYSKLIKRAKEALLHAGQYSFNDRRKRGEQFRRIWIQRINTALQSKDIKYSVFIKKLSDSKIELNRKVLAFLALDYPEVFDSVVKEVK